MQIKQTLVRLALIIFPFSIASQTTYLPQGAEENILIERMEIKMQKDSVLNFSKIKPFSREAILAQLQNGSFNDLINRSKVDEYNYRRLLINSLEWVKAGQAYQSKKPFWKSFYKTPGTLYEVHQKDFDLAINPVLQFQFSKENNNSEILFLN